MMRVTRMVEGTHLLLSALKYGLSDLIYLKQSKSMNTPKKPSISYNKAYVSGAIGTNTQPHIASRKLKRAKGVSLLTRRINHALIKLFVLSVKAIIARAYETKRIMTIENLSKKDARDKYHSS